MQTTIKIMIFDTHVARIRDTKPNVKHCNFLAFELWNSYSDKSLCKLILNTFLNLNMKNFGVVQFLILALLICKYNILIKNLITLFFLSFTFDKVYKKAKTFQHIASKIMRNFSRVMIICFFKYFCIIPDRNLDM